MTRDQLAREVSKEIGISIEAARRALDAALEKMSQALIKGDRIELRNFGIFTTQDWTSRQVVDPIRGQTTIVPARRAVRFKMGLGLRQRLNAPKPAKKGKPSKKRT